MDTKTVLQLTKGCKEEEQYTVQGCNAFGQKFTAEGAYVERFDKGEPAIEEDRVYFGFGQKLDLGLCEHREIIAPYRTKYPTYEKDGKEVINERILDHCLFIERVLDSNGSVILDNAEFVEEHKEEMEARFETFALKESDNQNFKDATSLIGQPSVYSYPDGREVKGVTAFLGQRTDCGDAIVETVHNNGIGRAYLYKGVNVCKLGQESAEIASTTEDTLECV